MSGEGMPKETRDKLGATTPATVLIDEDFRSLPDSVQPPEVVIQEEDYYHGLIAFFFFSFFFVKAMFLEFF